jgi:hypothetical protein
MERPQQTISDVDLYVIVWGLAELHAGTFDAFRTAVKETGEPFTTLEDSWDSFDEGLIPIALSPFESQDTLNSWLKQLPAAQTGKYPFDELPIAVVVGEHESPHCYLVEGAFTVPRVKALLRLVAETKIKMLRSGL